LSTLTGPKGRAILGVATPEILASRIRQRRPEIEAILLEISDRRAVSYEIEAALATLEGAPAEVARHAPAPVEAISVFLPSNVLLYSWVLYAAVPLLYAEHVHMRAASAVRPQMDKLHSLLTMDMDLPLTLHDLSQREFVDLFVLQSDVVVFTGSYQNAESVRHQLDATQLMVYMGSGPNPFVIGVDADLKWAAEQLVAIRCMNSGQDCLAPDVVFVHSAVQDAFLEELELAIGLLVRGDPAELDVHRYGRIHYQDALSSTSAFMVKHRSRIVKGGSIDFLNGVIDPTIIVWEESQLRKVATAEFFAPVFNIAVYPDEMSVLGALTGGRFAETAMGVSLFGCSAEAGNLLRHLYTVVVENSMLAADDGNTPLGGRGPMANYVAHEGRLYPRPILISQAIADQLGARGSARKGRDHEEVA
jgi:acyl-CoA reductase-like NAD-dependent aldehyde dehydrogenase